MVELAVHGALRLREQHQGVRAVVVGQRLRSVDAVGDGALHVFAETLAVDVASGLRFEHRMLELELHGQIRRLDVREELRQRPLVGLPVVVGLHEGVVDAERLPAVVARGTVVGHPVERLVERMQVLRHARDDLVGLLVLVVEVAGIGGQLLRDDVEARQFDVLVIGRIETRAHLVDIPLVGRDAVLVVREVELAAVHLAPVDRRRGGVAVLQEVDRVGEHHHHLALRGGRAQALRSSRNGLFEGIDAAVGTEPVVDQVVPLLAVGRVARIAQHADHVGVIDPSGNIRILRLEEKEAVEEPVLLARLVGVAHQRREALLLPEIGVAVVAAAVAEHHVRIGEDAVTGALPGVGHRVGVGRRELQALQGAVAALLVEDRGEDRVGDHRFEPLDRYPVVGVPRTPLKQRLDGDLLRLLRRKAQHPRMGGVEPLYVERDVVAARRGDLHLQRGTARRAARIVSIAVAGQRKQAQKRRYDPAYHIRFSGFVRFFYGRFSSRSGLFTTKRQNSWKKARSTGSSETHRS